MKIKANHSDGKNLSQECLELGFTPESKFDFRSGQEFFVYGVCLWRNILLYLICDNTPNPNWYPSELFEVKCSHIPPGWEFTTYEKDEYSIKAVLGYSELLHQSHYTGIIERNPDALEIFYKVKSEIDSTYLGDCE